MESDPIRKKIHDLLWRRGLTMREASLAIGRNPSYLHRFLERGMPKILSYQDAGALAELLGCEPGALQHPERPRRRRRGTGADPGSHGTGTGPPGNFVIPEVEVEASAGPGALNGEFVDVKAHWHLPDDMVRHEGGADPGDLRILRVRGESMEPELSDGDRLVVDTAHRSPGNGGMFVLWDGNGLVVKRIERPPADGGVPRLRLKSANPHYAEYDCPVGEAHIAGRVLWVVRKV